MTGSVSTVMVLVGSLPGRVLEVAKFVTDRFAKVPGGFNVVVLAALALESDSGFSDPGIGCWEIAGAESIGLGSSTLVEGSSWFAFCINAFSSPAVSGVEGKLPSSTVSSGD